MAKYAVEIVVDRLSPGSMPVYTSEPDEEWYYLDSDGKTWKTHQGKQCHAPEFEIAGMSQRECAREIERALATICLLQEHGGTAIMAVRNFMAVQGPERTVWSLAGSLIMTEKSIDGLTARGSPNLPELAGSLVVDELTLRHLDNEEAVEQVHDL